MRGKGGVGIRREEQGRKGGDEREGRKGNKKGREVNKERK